MPGWSQLELFGEVAAKVADESPAVERIADEVLSTVGKVVGTEAAPVAAIKSATAGSLIESGVERGEIPQGIYRRFESWADLRDPRTVTVQRTYFSNNRAWLRGETEGNGWRNSAVYLNGERAGLFDRMGDVRREDFPLSIRSVNVALSDQRTISIPERDLQVIERWNHEGGRSWPDKGLVLSSQPVRVTPYATLSFANASRLKPGAKLITEFPFQQVGDELTNGVWKFPMDARKIEPSELLWQYPYSRPDLLVTNLTKLPDEHYQTFLQSLAGKTTSEAQLPEWIHFDGSKAPVAENNMLVGVRPRTAPGVTVSEAPSQLTKNAYLTRLTGGKTVSVDSVGITQHNIGIKLDPRDGQYLDQGVYVDGKRVGALDHQSSGRSGQLPFTISKATVKLSDGRELDVSDHDLAVVSDWGSPNRTGRFEPTLSQAFQTKPVRVTPVDSLSFAEAKVLQPGTTFRYDFPFQQEQYVIS